MHFDSSRNRKGGAIPSGTAYHDWTPPMPGQTPPSFATDIRPLFRDSDIEAMRDWFDLASHAEVKENADIILERLEDGSMPTDGGWPDEHIALFRAWRDGGCAA